MSVFAYQLAAAQTRWDAAVLLLERWQDRPAGVRPERDTDTFLGLVDEVRAHFDARPADVHLTDVDRGAILHWTETGTNPHRVDAVGFGLNLAASSTFASSWRQQLGGDTYRPEPGDVFPAADAPWPPDAGSDTRTPSPRSMGIDADDHPFARTFRADMLAVEFDLTLWRPLRRICRNLDRIAAASVNETLAELGLDTSRPVAFPVSAADPAEQGKRVLELLDRAIDADAQVTIFPELSSSAAIADRIAQRLDDEDEQRLVVCGSWHESDPATGQPANVSVGVISGVRGRMRHRKIAEFGDLYPKDPSRRIREGIVTADPPLLRIYVADRFRVALTICKDFLDRRVAATLDHVAANVLLVPALSRTMHPFSARAAAHVSDAQAVTVAANGPRVWSKTPVRPTALVCRPYEPRDRIAAVAGTSPSLLLFSVMDGTVRHV